MPTGPNAAKGLNKASHDFMANVEYECDRYLAVNYTGEDDPFYFSLRFVKADSPGINFGFVSFSKIRKELEERYTRGEDSWADARVFFDDIGLAIEVEIKFSTTKSL